MIRSGLSTVHPPTGTRTLVVDTHDRGWVLEVRCIPGRGPHILEHVHDSWTESFDIVAGHARYRLNGREGTAGRGDTIVMPPSQPHVHPWCEGDEALVYRQRSVFAEADPAAADDVLGAFITINGLMREGKVGRRGLPRNPFQFAATLRALVRHGGYDAAAPIFAQKALAATVGRVAEWLGYRAAYPRYLEAAGHESP